jgi:hypothetical protein
MDKLGINNWTKNTYWTNKKITTHLLKIDVSRDWTNWTKWTDILTNSLYIFYIFSSEVYKKSVQSVQSVLIIDVPRDRTIGQNKKNVQ